MPRQRSAANLAPSKPFNKLSQPQESRLWHLNMRMFLVHESFCWFCNKLYRWVRQEQVDGSIWGAISEPAFTNRSEVSIYSNRTFGFWSVSDCMQLLSCWPRIPWSELTIVFLKSFYSCLWWGFRVTSSIKLWMPCTSSMLDYCYHSANPATPLNPYQHLHHHPVPSSSKQIDGCSCMVPAFVQCCSLTALEGFFFSRTRSMDKVRGSSAACQVESRCHSLYSLSVLQMKAALIANLPAAPSSSSSWQPYP